MPKNNEKLLCYLRKTWLSLRIVGLIAGIFLAVAVAYAKLNGQVSTNKATAVEALEKVDANEKAIIGLQKDVEYIKRGVDDIKRDLKDARR